jgi:hypothetical protein
MIVVDLENNVVGSAPIIERVDSPTEMGLIKVNMYPEQEYGFFYIGTLDRDLYTIYTDTIQPEPDKEYKFYVLPDGIYQYIEIIKD